jgi:hypothetical protein
MSRVASRARAGTLPVAVRAEGVWVEDVTGRRYLDGAGGAVVCGIGHGRGEIAEVLVAAAQRLDYVHASTFTTPALEDYAEHLARVLPVEDPRVFPVSGGSEATETALKLVRAYHLARAGPERTVVVGRWGSYHGNTLGALDLSGREPLRSPYLPWLGRFHHQPAVSEYRCPAPTHPQGCGGWHAERLEERIVEGGDVAAFVAEPISGASLGAAVPPDDYWPAIAEVCRRHDVLLVVDEVMTGFGRTGRWFGIEHWAVGADILIAGKGVSSGYWPLGLCVASGRVWETVEQSGGFVHGFTFSHHPIGAEVGRAVLGILEKEDLVARAAAMGDRLLGSLQGSVGSHPLVGEVRGRGLLVGIELVEEKETRRPFPSQAGMAHKLSRACFEEGLLVYPSTGSAGSGQGDVILLGPPFVVTVEECDEIVARLARALDRL